MCQSGKALGDVQFDRSPPLSLSFSHDGEETKDPRLPKVLWKTFNSRSNSNPHHCFLDSTTDAVSGGSVARGADYGCLGFSPAIFPILARGAVLSLRFIQTVAGYNARSPEKKSAHYTVHTVKKVVSLSLSLSLSLSRNGEKAKGCGGSMEVVQQPRLNPSQHHCLFDSIFVPLRWPDFARGTYAWVVAAAEQCLSSSGQRTRPTMISFSAKEIDVVEWKGDILAVDVIEKDMVKYENLKFQNPILKKLDSHMSGLWAWTIHINHRCLSESWSIVPQDLLGTSSSWGILSIPQAERELAKARVDIAHEVRLAREAEDSMELHVAKAGKKGEREIAKHTANHNQPRHSVGHQNDCPADTNDPHGQVCPNNLAGSSTATAASGLKNTTNTAGAPPKNNQLLPPDFNIFTSK
ncbi:hypothetical protein RHSIM_Rhsim01G0146400 [Rhododendron simsii]|uniref:Uncharacterized protein n=1 Tax=Rhododendron simsii TaxID=118357 RepID=A0A834LZR2_RHOSS|nr:hypothetical protein RHSIM_Rhsim01G0146400 [Rhododendron simsii]